MLIVILLSVFAFTQTQAQCDYEIALYDDWGDGWNGGTVSVYVDGTVVLNNITLATGAGPEYYTFQVTTGAEIITVYTPGGWSYENEYHIIDAIGTVVWIDCGSGTTPTGIGPGLLFGNSPLLLGTFEGYVMNGQGLSISGADVYVELVPAWAAVTNPTGYYIITNVQPATWNVVASRVGYWNDTASVTVISDDTVQQDFILTRPQVTITPLLLNALLHPNQTYTNFIGILNTGDGLCLWNAVIVYPPTDGDTESIHVPAFTGEVEKVRHPNSTGLAPKELAKQGNPGKIYQTDNFRGSVAFGYQAVGTDEFVNFDIDDVGAYTVVANATTPNFVAGVAYPVGEEDFVYGVVNGSSNLYEIDVATGTWTDLGSMGVTGFNDMTVDPTSGAFYVATGNNLYIIEANIPSATLIGAFTNSNEMIGIACDGDGNLWGYDIGNDNFYSIDKNTGLATVVGSLGFNASYAQCAFYDPETEQVLLGAFNAGNNYCEIRAVDVTTGASVILSSVYYKEMTAAAIPVGTGGWLSLWSYSGMVPPYGGSENIGVNFNAQGFASGNYLTAEIIFTFFPDVGTITVPVSMTIFGDTLNMPYNLVVTLINEITGEVYLTWDIDGNDFQYFIVYRNGVFLATTTNQFGTDFLPDYGEYCYTVVAVYDQGQTAPAGPECIEWSNPTMVINPMSLYAAVWPNHTVMVSTNISNTGIGSLSYAFPDFVPGDGLFITSVLPGSGILVPGESVNINITYDATGFDPGFYIEWLYIESNDPNRLYDSIFNEMLVYQPAQITGTVTNGNTGAPIGGVEVTVGIWQTMTAPDGTYSLYVDPGYYDMAFEKAGFQTLIVPVHAVIVTQLDVQMFEEAYPPAFVTATVNDDDTECLVEWSVPMGPYEIIYDDGSADDYFVWSTPGNANAVKFTPAGYPATIIGGKIYVGDGSFPVGANFLGTTFGVVVYDDDGVGGLPGTQLDSIGVCVNNYGWVDFEGLYATIDDGDFFIAMFQGGIPPNTAPVGIDYTIPTVYRSYSYDAGFDVWALSAYQDFMIRAIVSGPQSDDGMAESTEVVYPTKPIKHNFFSIHTPKGIPGTVKSGEYRPVTDSIATNRVVVCYTITRFSNFDPNGSPLFGDAAVLATGLTGLTYIDFAFAGLPMGWYAYCVKAHYTNGDVSDCAVSNIVGHLMDAQFIINVSLITGGNPEGAEVSLYAYDYPYCDYFIIMDTTGIDTIESVWKGYYDLCVFKPGYVTYCIEINIFGDTTININLEEKKYPPYNLYVDPLTSIATWNEPRITALKEDFNGALFPPQGWTSETQGLGWFATYDGSSYGFPIPPHDSQYACASSDMQGCSGNGCCDYLITPPLDLRESEGYSLKYESYYDGGYGQLAYVEYSYDAGTTWEVIDQLSPASTWVDLEVDMSSFSGMTAPASIWLAFHSDDQGSWASGWAIDNVEVSVGNDEWPPLGYHVFLDDIYVAVTQETTYLYQNLTYGVEYEASVGVIYTSGLSGKDYYTFTSIYLVPPCNLQGMSPAGTDYAYLVWLPPVEPADYTILSEELRTEKPDKNAEYSPTVRVIEGESIGRDQWDVQYNFPVGVAGGEAGNESNGSYIYTTKWNAGNGTFYKYELDGTYLETFTISGCQDIRDLAYDGTYMYGSNATTSVWEMDFDGQTVISTINAPTPCRAIAYDEQADGFWCNNWSTDITLFDKTGAQLNSFPVGAYGSFYGFAYDGWSSNGPFLWGQSQDGSGAEIVQIDIATGVQIFNFNVLPIVGGSQIAGGMFSHCELIEPNLATLGGILQNELLYGLELAPCGGTGPVISNLLGFNTYRDGVFQDYIEWIQGNPSTLVDWYDFGLEPSTYEYSITAVYDLTPYGFPGDTAESMEEGPVNVTVTYGYPFPFFEDWQSGNFNLNEWTVECDNWCINSQTGNPLPSAEFQYDPVLTDYEYGLISHPLLAYGMVDGEIWFDFDIMLDSRFDTAVNEKMIVKIWENHEWHVLAEFINEGDMDWTSNHIDITTIAKGSDFKLGFFATGLNSINIIGWNIDNINVYRVCRPPFDLTADMEWYTTEIHVYLNWIAPYAMQGEWMSYNDGTFENALASTDGGAGLAQIFTPTQYPCMVTEVRFFVSGYMNYYQDEEVYVLTGDGATILAGPYVVQGVENDWVTVDIADVTITDGTFMVATFNVLPDGPFIGMDDSYYDASLYFGSIGSFTELGQYGYFYIGSHEAYVEYEITDNVVVNSVLTRPQSNGSRAEISESNTFFNGTLKPTRYLLGFNIFRNEGGGEFELIDYTTDIIYTDTLYTYYTTYCYYITAVYDQCESDSSNNACIGYPYGIEEFGSESIISVYPNPATGFVNIESTENITKITVINYVGQLVYEKKVSDETNIYLNTASYESGVYILKIETENGITAKRITITR